MPSLNKHLLIISLAIAIPAVASAANVRPFLQQHCIGCHSGKMPDGKLSLATPHIELAKQATNIEIWKNVLDKLETGEMPPENSDQPTPQDRLAAVQSIKGML